MNKSKRINSLFVLSIVAVCFFLLLSQPASAATYYVSPSGNDANNGLSTGAAWKSPSYAASRAVAGDTIYLMNGVWYNQHVVFNKKGTSTAPITMKAYSGTPVLDGVDKTGFGILISSGSWINIEGIDIKNYQYGYWATYSNHLKLVNCDVSNTAMDGITLWNDVDYVTMDSVTVKNVGDHGIHLWNQDQPSRSEYITIKNSAISNAPHNLVDIHTNVCNVAFENNELFFTSDFTSRQVGLYLHNGNTDDIVIRNNVFRDQARPLEIFNSKNVQVTGNTFRNINGKGILLASVKGYDTDLGVFDSTFTGNTFDNVYYAFCFWGGYSKYTNLYFANNNFAKVTKSDYYSTSAYTMLLTGNRGLPQILNSRNQYYTVLDIIKSPYTAATSTPTTSTDKFPVANAGADVTISAGSTVTLNGGASSDDKGISSYSWDFDASNGIQNDATGMSVSRAFNTAGKFTVTLTVTDTAGQKSKDTCLVTVIAPTSTDKFPVANAGADATITVGSSVTLNGGASSDDKGISSYSWDLDASNGIQNDATGKTVSRVFNTAGKFTVTLTVTDTAGQKSRDTCIVTVIAPTSTDKFPVANAGADVTITAGSTITLNGAASSDDKGISSYSWDFDASNGIQNDATGKTVSRAFNTAGKFIVTLTVTDTAGQKSKDTCLVTVNAPVVSDAKPTANAGADVIITAGSTVTLNGGASSDDKGISSYSWDFDASNGIQNEATSRTVSRVFNTAGKFTVTLTVTDTAGQKSTDTCIVTVNAPAVSTSDKPPIANAGYDRASTVGQRVYFNGYLSKDDKGIKTYSWDFDASNGIQASASGMYVSYAFTTAKTYTVTLTVTDTAGQKSSDTVLVRVS